MAIRRQDREVAIGNVRAVQVRRRWRDTHGRVFRRALIGVAGRGERGRPSRRPCCGPRGRVCPCGCIARRGRIARRKGVTRRRRDTWRESIGRRKCAGRRGCIRRRGHGGVGGGQRHRVVVEDDRHVALMSRLLGRPGARQSKTQQSDGEGQRRSGESSAPVASSLCNRETLLLA
jgi:hypothetical protein